MRGQSLTLREPKMDRYNIVERIAKYAEEVNRFPSTYENKLYWSGLTPSRQMQVLRKWRKLAIEARQRA